MPSSEAHNTPEENSISEPTGNHPENNPPHHHRRWVVVMQTLTLITVLLLSTYNHARLTESPESTAANSLLVESEPFDDLVPCTEGGVRLHAGFEADQNGVLGIDERLDSAVL